MWALLLLLLLLLLPPPPPLLLLLLLLLDPFAALALAGLAFGLVLSPFETPPR